MVWIDTCERTCADLRHGNGNCVEDGATLKHARLKLGERTTSPQALPGVARGVLMWKAGNVCDRRGVREFRG